MDVHVALVAPLLNYSTFHVSMPLELHMNIACAAVLGCIHLLLIAATASACAMLSWGRPIMRCAFV